MADKVLENQMADKACDNLLIGPGVPSGFVRASMRTAWRRRRVLDARSSGVPHCSRYTAGYEGLLGWSQGCSRGLDGRSLDVGSA